MLIWEEYFFNQSGVVSSFFLWAWLSFCYQTKVTYLKETNMKNKKTFRFILLFFILTFLMSIIAYTGDGDQIDNNEKVVFFPSYGYFNSSLGKWVIIIQGHIFEPSRSSVKRSAAKSGFENYKC